VTPRQWIASGGIVTLTLGGQPEVGDGSGTHIMLHFGRTYPGAKH
jgi:hypothetical protein